MITQNLSFETRKPLPSIKYYEIIRQLIVLFAISCAVSFGNALYAQSCPDANTPVPGASWHGPYSKTVTLPGTTCVVTITFCDRPDDDGDWEIIITSVTPDPTCAGCSSLTATQLIQGSYDYFSYYLGTYDPGDVNILPCDGMGTQSVRTYSFACWKAEHITVNGQLVLNYAYCQTAQFCTTTCTICKDAAGVLHRTGCSTSGALNPDCPSAPNGAWTDGQCYSVPCTSPR